jgi:hypothetical protein
VAKRKKTAPERLAELSKVPLKRGVGYGRYERVGEVLEKMFEDGITLKTAADYNRFSLFYQAVNKLVRCSTHLPGKIHEDSVDDAAVYLMMLRTTDDGGGR